MRNCSWCKKELNIANCDFWDDDKKEWKLELCDECHIKRFSFTQKKTTFVSMLKKFIGEIESL